MYNEAAVKSRIQNYSDDEIHALISRANNSIRYCEYNISTQKQILEICKDVLKARENYRCKQCRYFISNWETCSCHTDYTDVNANKLACNDFKLMK